MNTQNLSYNMVSLVAQVEGRLQTYRSNPLQYDIVLETLLIGPVIVIQNHGVRDIFRQLYSVIPS